MINNEFVEQACIEVSEYSVEQRQSEFERFFRLQEHLCDFIAELTQDSSPEIRELSMFLSFMVFKAVETAGQGEVPSVSPETIEASFQESEAWIEKMNQEEEFESSSSMRSTLGKDTEPHLLHYVISEINEPLDDGTEFADEQKGEVFFVLKTVISALSRNNVEKPETTEPT